MSYAPLFCGVPVAMPHPAVLRQVLLETPTLRGALLRIYGSCHEDAFYSNAKEVMGRLDNSCGTLYELECRYGLLEKLAPEGSLQQTRKVWSYSGGICKNRGLPLSMLNGDPSAVRDPGNYCYGVVMRHLASCWPDQHWLGNNCRLQFNDATLGDILEAVLGVAWLCRHGHLAGSLQDLDILNQYTLAIERCVVDAERVLDLVHLQGIWTDSKSMARLLE